MQTRLSTLHEKVLRHDYTKYAYVYIVFLGPENKRKRGKRRTSRRPRNQKGIACIRCSNDGEETETRSGKCESKAREEEEEEAERGTRGKGESETDKYQKGEEKERDGEKDRADRDEAKVCTRARIHRELWQQPSTRVRTLVTVFSNTMHCAAWRGHGVWPVPSSSFFLLDSGARDPTESLPLFPSPSLSLLFFSSANAPTSLAPPFSSPLSRSPRNHINVRASRHRHLPPHASS